MPSFSVCLITLFHLQVVTWLPLDDTQYCIFVSFVSTQIGSTFVSDWSILSRLKFSYLLTRVNLSLFSEEPTCLKHVVSRSNKTCDLGQLDKTLGYMWLIFLSSCLSYSSFDLNQMDPTKSFIYIDSIESSIWINSAWLS